MKSKKELLNKLQDAQERLNFVADGQNEIGNLCIIVSQLTDVLTAIVKEQMATDIDEADAMFRQHQEMKEAHYRTCGD